MAITKKQSLMVGEYIARPATVNAEDYKRLKAESDAIADKVAALSEALKGQIAIGSIVAGIEHYLNEPSIVVDSKAVKAIPDWENAFGMLKKGAEGLRIIQ